MALIHKSKENKEQKPAFDGFDCNGKPTGNKCILCIHQNLKCPYQSFFGEGAALICTYDLENCFKDIKKDLIMGRIFIRRNEEEEYKWHVPFRSQYCGDPDGEIPPSSARVYFELKDHRIVEGEIVVEPSGFYTYYDNNWQGWSQILKWKFR